VLGVSDPTPARDGAERRPTPGAAEGVPTPGPWQEPVRGGPPSARLTARPGAEQLQALIDQTTPAPPLSHLTGMRIDQIGDATAVFSMPMSPWLARGDGGIPLGPLAIPTDGAMACAIISQLPAHTGLTTTELSLRRLRPAPPGERLTAHGRLVEWGEGVALSQASLVDASGRAIAQASSLCVTLPMVAEPAGDRDAEPDAAEALPAGAPPDPWQRPGAPPDGLAELTGLREVAAAQGAAQFILPASPWLCAPPPGRAQGGMVVVLAEAALSAAIRGGESAPADAGRGCAPPRFVTTEIKLNFVRPLITDGRLARAEGRLIHRGRRLAVAESRVFDAGGRLVAVATGSAVAVAADADAAGPGMGRR
jgi:uncharacterized protein (TIGR00369 family)